MFDIEKIFSDNEIKTKSVYGSDERILVCPVCKKDDHFYFNIKKNLGMCHRCKWQCNAVGLLMEVLAISKKAAVALLYGRRDTSVSGLRGKVARLLYEGHEDDEDIGMREIYFKNPLPKGLSEITKKKFPKVFRERGVKYDLAVSTGAMVCDSGKYYNRIIFPIKTLGSETFTAVTAFSKEDFVKIRDLARKRGEKYRKSMFPEHSFMSEIIYMYNEIKNYTGRIFLVEGIWDFFKLRKFGLVVGGLLGSYIGRRQAYLLSRTRSEEIFIMLDGSLEMDEQKKNHNRLSEICFDKTIRTCFLPDGKDPDEATKEEILKAIRNSRNLLL